jgi:ABC-type sugar transport system permease subunit
MPKIKLSNKHREWLNGYLFAGLWIIGLLAFTIWPLIQAFYYSFNEAVFYGNSIKIQWIWFENFRYAFFEDLIFPVILINYLLEIIIDVPFAITAALIIAMLLNQKIKFRGVWRVIFFLPVIISTGPVIFELMGQGATSIPMLSDGSFTAFIRDYLPSFISRPILLLFEKLIIVLWFSGIQILIFLAGLQRIDHSIYEAAAIDGASSWQSFWKITLPSMKPFILLNVIYTIVTLSFFDMPTPRGQYSILSYIRDQTFSKRGFGYGCALGIIFFILILLQIGIYVLFLRERKVRR